MIKDIIRKSRSYRRFYGEKDITMGQLRELVDLARMSPSMGNKQPLKYILVCDPEMNEKVFEHLLWAGYLKEWPGPISEERPTGYIVMLRDKSINQNLTLDEGICGQSILLGATEQGLGGCMIATFHKDKLTETLQVSDGYDIALVIALGYPKEEVVMDPVKEDGDIKYWRDENQVHHVPKRSLDELIINEIK